MGKPDKPKPPTRPKFLVTPNRVLVRKTEYNDTTRGGIALPAQYKSDQDEGVIVGVGPVQSAFSGKIYGKNESFFRVGDEVIFSTKHGADKVKVDGEDLFLLPFENVLVITSR